MHINIYNILQFGGSSFGDLLTILFRSLIVGGGQLNFRPRLQQHFVVAWCLIALIRAVLHRLYNKNLMSLILGIHDGVDHLDIALVWHENHPRKVAEESQMGSNVEFNIHSLEIGFPIR